MAIITDKPTSSTQLTGTADSDVFRMVADGNPDAIIGFQLGSDIIDLGLFEGLAFDDLLIRDGKDGKISIQFTNAADGSIERIVLKNNATAFTAAEITASSFNFFVAQAAPEPTNTVNDNFSAFTQMTGTDAGDLFVLVQDGEQDVIIGFENNIDLIDFSAYETVTFADLDILGFGIDPSTGTQQIRIDYPSGIIGTDGIEIVERLVLRGLAEGFLTDDLTEADFVFAEAQSPGPEPGITTTNDVLDLDGKTALRGTSANDAFIMLADGQNDAIRGFEDGKDIIDLSAFANIGFDDLRITDVGTGRVLITFRTGETDGNGRLVDEKTLLRDLDPSVTAASLTSEDFVFAGGTPTTPETEPETPNPGFTPEATVNDTGAVDALRGTDASEQFVFSLDGVNDSIAFFEDGNDLIDLSAVTGLSFEDLDIRDLAAGKVLVTYFNGTQDGFGRDVFERLLLKNLADGTTAEDITVDDFVFA